VWAATASAHPVPFSYLDLRLQAGGIDASLVMHVIDVAHELGIDAPDTLLDPQVAKAHEAEIAAIIARRLGLDANGRRLAVAWTGIDALPDRQAVRLRARISLDAPAGTLAIDGVLFPYDPEHRTFVNVYEDDEPTQAIVDAGRTRFEYFAGTPQGALAVVQTFIPAGVRHIMIGPDHILFLVGLLLLGGTARRLALIVTGFTLAHSLTLSLAALHILSPPASVIEPAIALSIIFIGADNLMKKDGRDIRAWIAFGFGFIHGFGFANVLGEMGLPARALGWSLLSFNVGVEIGQLAIVGAVAALLGLVRSRSEVFGRRLAVAGSVVVIAAGTFWFAERMLFPGGL
jgi:hydrogenase/urease accessory protein HupE